MKRFGGLMVSDFPGVDPIKFNEWKQAALRNRSFIYIVFVIYLVLNIKSYGITGRILLDTPMVFVTGLLLDSQYTRFAMHNQKLYVIMSLCFLIVFNVVLFFNTGLYVGESLIVIVVLFWLFFQFQKNSQLALEMGIDGATLKRVLSK